MKFNKLKAFTMAEVLVLLLTLSILLAAFAPMMTKRQNNIGFDDVWTFVSSDDHFDAYFDSTNKNNTAQAYIGIPVSSSMDVNNSVKDGNNKVVYSKLVIRSYASDSSPQRQMQFREKDEVLGTLFAGAGNLLLGGQYKNLRDTNSYLSTEGCFSSRCNTAYGYNALTSLTVGKNNTAIGSKSLRNLTKGTNNTTVGYSAGGGIVDKSYNTLVGAYAAPNNPIGDGNTLIGADVVGGATTNASVAYNTAFGAKSLNKLESGSYNTAFGFNSLYATTSGSKNTAIGYNTLANVTTGSGNTAIGYNAGNNMTTGSNKTFVGANAGSGDSFTDLFTGDEERVFIGAIPKNTLGSNKPGAVLEVHNIKTTNSNMYPMKEVGNETVVINGNLVVRGQTYLETPIRRQHTIQMPYRNLPKGLVAYHLVSVGDKKSLFVGYDGMLRDDKSYQECKGCKQHEYKDIRRDCICTAYSTSSGTQVMDYLSAKSYDLAEQKSAWQTFDVSKSYDWTSSSSGSSGYIDCISNNMMGNSYVDRSTGVTMQIYRYPYDSGENKKKFVLNGTDLPYAHLKGAGATSSYGTVYSSCCPNLTSDRRLKNVGDNFSAGLAELKKINVYNYTFKNDKNKTPHVGVIAQDLKTVFPNAVTKDENGYYRIRWDEMLYAVVNSIKDLNARIEKIASKISEDRARISNLKKDNAELNAKLDSLEIELTKLELKK